VGEAGFTVHGTGFRPASLESGLFFQGTPRRLRCVTFAPTSRFSPYLLHTRQYTDTSQRVRGWWERRGSQFMGRGFDLRPQSQGCSLRGPPADFTVTFAPTSQFSPYLLHTRQYTDTPQRVRGWWEKGGVHSSWDGVLTCVPGVRVVPSGDPPPTSLCNLRSHQPILPLSTIHATVHRSG